MIDRVVAAFVADKFLNTFIPRPTEEEDNWYTWNVENWGTKWDVGGREDQVERIDPHTVRLTFDSAWSPPVVAYDTLTDQEFTVEAQYYEPGMAFVGEYHSDFGDNSYQIPQTADEVVDTIPQHLDEQWGISEYMRDCEEEEGWSDEDEENDENLEIDLGEPPEEDDDGEENK